MDPNSETQEHVESTTTENNGEAVKVAEPIDGEGHQENGEGAQPKEDEQPNQEPEKPKKSRAQERIEQTTRENADLKRRLAEYESKQNAPKASERPKVEEFETYDEFQEKLGEWQIEEAMRRLEEKQGKTSQEKQQQEREIEFTTAVAELESEGVDVHQYFEKANALPPLPVTLDQFGLSAKETLQLAQKLIDDEDLYFELSKMNPYQAAARIGTLLPQAQKTAPKIPNAPKPIKPTSANAPVVRDSEKMSDDEWYKAELEKRKGK